MTASGQRNDSAPRVSPGAQVQGQPLQMVVFGCSTVEEVEPQALGFTYWFDARPEGEPYAVTVRFTGHRLGVRGKPTTRDSFKVQRTLDPVIPGSGRIALTTRVLDVEPGEWRVSASPIAEPAGNSNDLQSLRSGSKLLIPLTARCSKRACISSAKSGAPD